MRLVPARDERHVDAGRRAVAQHRLEDRRQAETDLFAFPDSLSVEVQTAGGRRDGVLMGDLAGQLAGRRFFLGRGAAAGGAGDDEVAAAGRLPLLDRAERAARLLDGEADVARGDAAGPAQVDDEVALAEVL